MKCPKCGYLGFDTGDRCRNCGYDFSLIADTPASAAVQDPDLPLRSAEQSALPPSVWPDHLDRALGGTAASGIEPPQPPPSFRGQPARAHRAGRSADPSLPLFGRAPAEDDEPLIKVPAAPRPPLAVRRTPDAPARRGREALQRPPREQQESEPTLAFPSELADEVAPARREKSDRRATLADAVPEPSGITRRVIAAAIDHVILLAVDATVIYFTLQLASLTWSDWRLLSPVPLLIFLGLIKFAYFSAFTGVGGQTIGKMAVRIRVVADDNQEVDPACALRRSLAGAVSLLTLGVGFVPALLAADRRALHDRLAHTRVVMLPSE